MGTAPLCAQGCDGFLTPDPSYRPWQDDTLCCSAVQTTAEVNGRIPRSSRDARRCPARPNTESRGAPLPETGPQAGGDQRRPRQGLQLWPVLYLRARGTAKRTGGDRADTPGGDPWRPVPALARRRSESSSIRHRPSSRLRATSTFRFNVAAAAPPSGPASFRERCLASPRPLRLAILHGTSGGGGRRGRSLGRLAGRRLWRLPLVCEVRDRL